MLPAFHKGDKWLYCLSSFLFLQWHKMTSLGILMHYSPSFSSVRRTVPLIPGRGGGSNLLTEERKLSCQPSLSGITPKGTLSHSKATGICLPRLHRGLSNSSRHRGTAGLSGSDQGSLQPGSLQWESRPN